MPIEEWGKKTARATALLGRVLRESASVPAGFFIGVPKRGTETSKPARAAEERGPLPPVSD